MTIYLRNIKDRIESDWLLKIINDYQDSDYHPGKFRMASSVLYSNNNSKMSCCVYRNPKSIVGVMIPY